MNDSLALKRATILLCTYNGADYLRAQLDSIGRQTHKNWRLIVSDDGSTDGTLDILNEYQARWGADKMQIRKGPCAGCNANFMSLFIDPTLNDDGVFVADQDDIWFDDKVERALKFVTTQDPQKPALYMARTLHVDANNNEIGLSRTRTRPPSFRNALVQCISGGNTYALNHAGKALLERAGVADAASPDWWIYQAITAANGCIFHDDQPVMRYRQHATNFIGANRGFKAKAWRIKQLFNGWYINNIFKNIRSLKQRSSLWTDDANFVLAHIDGLQSSSPFTRVYTWFKLGLYRQTCAENIAMILAFFCSAPKDNH